MCDAAMYITYSSLRSAPRRSLRYSRLGNAGFCYVVRQLAGEVVVGAECGTAVTPTPRWRASRRRAPRDGRRRPTPVADPPRDRPPVTQSHAREVRDQEAPESPLRFEIDLVGQAHATARTVDLHDARRTSVAMNRPIVPLDAAARRAHIWRHRGRVGRRAICGSRAGLAGPNDRLRRQARPRIAVGRHREQARWRCGARERIGAQGERIRGGRFAPRRITAADARSSTQLPP